MNTRFFSVNVGGSMVYAKMPGGCIKLPLQKNERDELVTALKEALEIIEDRPIPRDDATESG